MSELYDALLNRRSIRSYNDKPVSKETIEKIVEAGKFAPTGMGRQSPIIIAVTNKEMRDKLSRLNAKVMNKDIDPFYGAPAVLVVLADKEVPTHVYDGSLVMGQLMLAAYSEGVSSCWIHRAKEVFESDEGKAILKDLGIEGEYEGIGHCILGYSDNIPQPKERKDNYIYYVD
ncbi:MAG: nitroreductase [Erysipelotrichaceae bacterium]|nr:nitroreductase [Erysipelotrichaceae bacterium]